MAVKKSHRFHWWKCQACGASFPKRQNKSPRKCPKCFQPATSYIGYFTRETLPVQLPKQRTTDIYPIANLPEQVRDKLRAAFRATGNMDLWKENAIYHLDVIRQELEERGKKIEQLTTIIKSANGVLNGET